MQWANCYRGCYSALKAYVVFCHQDTYSLLPRRCTQRLSYMPEAISSLRTMRVGIEMRTEGFCNGRTRDSHMAFELLGSELGHIMRMGRRWIPHVKVRGYHCYLAVKQEMPDLCIPIS
jgi:hypothetical protein